MHVVQVAYGITVGARALLRAKSECVLDLLQGMETLTRSCFEAVRCIEVRCPACKCYRGSRRAVLAMARCRLARGGTSIASVRHASAPACACAPCGPSALPARLQTQNEESAHVISWLACLPHVYSIPGSCFLGKHVCAWLHEQDGDSQSVLHLKAVLSTVRGKPFEQHLEPRIIANIETMLKPVLPHPLPFPQHLDRQVTLRHMLSLLQLMQD